MPLICGKCRSAKTEVQIPYARMNLCSKCFIEFYVNRIRKTVEEFKMFRENNVVGVAVSGGKDSAALLHALRRAFPETKLVALHINLGIPEYSGHCQAKVEKLADMLDVELQVFDLYKELGIRIDDFRKTSFKKKLCSVCGTIKRRVFEEMAVKAQVQVLATGHNLEDVVGVMLNNFIYGRWEQFVRLKPVLPPLAEGMASKVKPLIRSPENENLLYCLFEDIPFREIDCPFSKRTGVRKRTEILETISKYNPYFKHQLLNRFLELIPLLEGLKLKTPSLGRCKVCGFPSSGEICAFCKRISLVKEPIKLKL
ncbi:MAG: ATP-binding protein [Candidatus Bathyarchaeia archaeon]